MLIISAKKHLNRIKICDRIIKLYGKEALQCQDIPNGTISSVKRRRPTPQKLKVFTKIGREISVIVKTGGANPNENSKLKDAIAKAKAANVPNENIERIIKKAAGDGEANNYEELIYEGYGPSGVAVVVETLTDNRNRTAGEMRHYFDKCGGNLGQSGSVMFMFDRKGIIQIEAEGLDEDTVMEAALRGGRGRL